MSILLHSELIRGSLEEMSDSRSELGRRGHRLNKIKNQYDVAIVGGGIYGAATAWEAASRGLSVILVEAEDFCSGTSANSLKTIHGGLRSLQRFDFPEMREYIRERRALLKIAPHLVSTMRCVIPTYPKFSKSRLFMGLGMTFYDLIAFDRNRGLPADQCIESTKIISAEQVRKLAPGFDSPEMTGGACWFDAQVYNSERLVLAFIMSAQRAGADVFNYVRKKQYVTEQGTITGLIVSDQLSGTEVSIKAKAVIDCCGPWSAQSDEFVSSTSAALQPELMARAVNLVIDRQLSDCALGASSQATPTGDSRLMFIAPWRKGSIVGTWYYPQTSSDNKLRLSDTELSQCLQQINSVFPSLKLERENVTQIHHGLQPAELASKKIQEPQPWRHTRIIDANAGEIRNGLFWVQGVKLTTARATAESVVDKLATYLAVDIDTSMTSTTALYGGDFSGYLSSDHLAQPLSKEVVTRLIRNYGSNVKHIMALCEQDASLASYLPGLDDTIKAELVFVIRHEMVYTLADVLLRRTDIGSFEKPQPETIEYCADVMAASFGWDTQQRAENIEQLIKAYPA